MDVLERMGYSLAIASSDSTMGDLYEGAIGSTLYISEFSIIVKDQEFSVSY